MKTARLAGQNGMTLTEIMIVTVIMVILAGLAIPNFRRTIEDARANEARANLMSIFFAEKVYKENTPSHVYYPASGTVTDEATIETNLRLDLNTQFYTISIQGTGATFNGTAARTDGSRTYHITESGDITGG